VSRPHSRRRAPRGRSRARQRGSRCSAVRTVSSARKMEPLSLSHSINPSGRHPTRKRVATACCMRDGVRRRRPRVSARIAAIALPARSAPSRTRWTTRVSASRDTHQRGRRGRTGAHPRPQFAASTGSWLLTTQPPSHSARLQGPSPLWRSSRAYRKRLAGDGTKAPTC
jgi:hypothetical protein